MPIDDEILKRLRNNDNTLTSLDFFNKQINNEEIKALGEALVNNKTLKELRLDNNQIGDEGASGLGEALVKNTSLTTLLLGSNKIRDAGAKVLGKALVQNTALKELYLTNNQIGNVGAKVLAKALVNNKTLTMLSLFNNQISDDGASVLGETLAKNTSLTTLTLGYNRISDEGAKVLGKAFAKNATLTTLYLDNNQISEAITIQIKGLVQRNKQYLQELQRAACQQLKVARVMLFNTSSADTEANHYLHLPLEIKEEIVKHVNKHSVFTKEQQRLILNYAEVKIVPVADKWSFFKVIKCDRVMKRLKQDEIEGAQQGLAI